MTEDVAQAEKSGAVWKLPDWHYTNENECRERDAEACEFMDELAEATEAAKERFIRAGGDFPPAWDVGYGCIERSTDGPYEAGVCRLSGVDEAAVLAIIAQIKRALWKLDGLASPGVKPDSFTNGFGRAEATKDAPEAKQDGGEVRAGTPAPRIPDSPPEHQWTELEMGILKVLYYKAMLAKNIVSALGKDDAGAINDALRKNAWLRASGIVANQKGLGYFRKDARPGQEPDGSQFGHK